MTRPRVAGAGVAVNEGVAVLDGLETALTPNVFEAVTVQVTPVAAPDTGTVRGLDGPVAVAPPVQVAVYDVIGDPPELGGVKDTTTDPPEGVAVPITGAPGCVA
jgi:hypothetical protein